MTVSQSEEKLYFSLWLGIYVSLVKWAEMAEVDGTFESVVYLVIRVQFIQTCSPELALFLEE